MFEEEREWFKYMFGIVLAVIISSMFIAIAAIGMTTPNINPPPATQHNHQQRDHAQNRAPVLERLER